MQIIFSVESRKKDCFWQKNAHTELRTKCVPYHGVVACVVFMVGVLNTFSCSTLVFIYTKKRYNLDIWTLQRGKNSLET